MMKILISRCLLGIPCRYDAEAKTDIRDKLHRIGFSNADLIDVCPETDGGLPAPRQPSEIEPGFGGADVLDGRAHVVDKAGIERTAAFLKGAAIALEKAEALGIRVALLKSKSPSCGTRSIYDGTFSRRLKPACGVCAAKLARAGITCLAEDELDALSSVVKGNSLK